MLSGNPGRCQTVRDRELQTAIGSQIVSRYSFISVIPVPSSADFISTLSCTHFGRRTFSAEHSQSNPRSRTFAVEPSQSNIYSRTLTVEPSQSNQSSKRHASRGSRRTLQSHNRRNEIPITFYDDADLLKRVRRDKRVSRIERTHVALAGKQKLWKQFRSLSHQTLAEVYYHLICFPISFSNRKRSNRKMLSLYCAHLAVGSRWWASG